MPKRTNRFQEIVAAIERSFAPKCARISTSEMIPMKGIGFLREIDVIIEVGPSHRRIKIAVEAKDHGRKLDVTAIETIIGKYRGEGCVPIDKVVVVASRGFTKTAHEKAKLEDIILLTLQETHEFDWVTIGSDPTPVAFPPAQCPFTIHAPIRIEKFEFEPALDANLLDQCQDAGLIVRNAGTQEEKVCGSPRNCSQCLLKRVLAEKEIVRAMYHNASVKKGRATAKAECKQPKLTVLRLKGTDHPIDCIRVHLTAEVQHSTLEWSTFKQQDQKGKTKTVRIAEAKTKDGTFRVVFPELLPGMKKTNPPQESQRHPIPEKTVHREDAE